MIVYGLSGKSGTGKSYHAGELCGKLEIESLVDDGLFMCGGSIIEGQSAKKQATKLGAVKTALFTDPEHCEKVKFAIRRMHPESILVLGTSDEMVERIANRLDLPKPEKIIHIEDVTTEEERQIARDSRDNTGTHIIPAPTFQLKKQFSGYFLDPKKSFKSDGQEKNFNEKTIVRPTYSYLGEFTISNKVISDIVNHQAVSNPGVSSILFVATKIEDNGIYVRIIANMNYGFKLKDCAQKLQLDSMEAITEMTAFNVLGIGVEIRGIRFGSPAKQPAF